MIVIDEIHNILAGAVKKRDVFLNVIRNLGNDLQVPIVGVGTELAVNAIESDKQLSSRFELAPVPRWDFDNEYRQLLASFEAFLPLRRPSDLSAAKIAFRIYNMTDGTIGETSALVNKAAVEAIRSGEDQINDQILNKVDWIAPSERRRHAMSAI
jgi:Bacterial TniB protein